jgi:Skp family chaperone for outer membrane proteins
MSADSPSEVINQHYTDAAPNMDVDELIWASEQLIKKHGTATKAAEKVKPGPSSVRLWNRLNRLPDDILGYVLMEQISPTSADIIRRLESTRSQRLATMVTIEESLSEDYVNLLQREISDENKTAEEAIESVVGESKSLRSVTMGFDESTYFKLWIEAGQRQCTIAELCERLIRERIGQIMGTEKEIQNKSKQIQDAASEAQASAEEFSRKLENLSQSVNELHQKMDDERL